MLSYQHGFHAGNFADVHKHSILVLLLEALNKKAKPWSYLETHGGAAFYDLTDLQAQKTGEYQWGVEKVFQASSVPKALSGYMEQINKVNAGSGLTYYPGSPLIASQMARAEDKLAIMELHPAEYERVKHAFKRVSQVAVHRRDGYEGVLALLPPKPNRGLVLIDPSYEVKTEYQQVAKYIKKVHGLWPNGTFAIWYPVLKAGLHQAMLAEIKKSGIRNIFVSEFYSQSGDTERMYGSGMILINPPWQIDETINTTMPWLKQTLAKNGAEEPRGEWLVPE